MREHGNQTRKDSFQHRLILLAQSTQWTVIESADWNQAYGNGLLIPPWAVIFGGCLHTDDGEQT